MSLLADGASVTHAAHAAGFADSAHLTRTAIQMNGFTPTKMPFRMWLTDCRWRGAGRCRRSRQVKSAGWSASAQQAERSAWVRKVPGGRNLQR